MPYEYLDNIATADVAFKATGLTIEEVFESAAKATVNVIIEDLSAIESVVEKRIELKKDNIEMLLFDFLQELLFYKDAETLLLLPSRILLQEIQGVYCLVTDLYGEEFNREKHKFNVDVKAVTLHEFNLIHAPDKYEAKVVLDV